MSLTRAAIRLNRVTLVVYTLAMLAGVLAYVNLPKEEDPGFVVRTVVISTFFCGRQPGTGGTAGYRLDRKKDSGDA